MNEKSLLLNNGIPMPRIGYGVFRMTDAASCEKAVIEAIHSGYRLIDTAAAYENEAAVGRAISRCGIDRKELFITTKLWITDTSYEGAKRGFTRSIYQREAERLYMESQHIQMQAWSPLAAGNAELLQNETLLAIAAHHQKSVAQVTLRFLVQKGIVPIVKSSNPARMKENLDIFDFTLSDAEIQEIANLDTGHTAFSPRETGPAVNEFLKKSLLYKL